MVADQLNNHDTSMVAEGEMLEVDSQVEVEELKIVEDKVGEYDCHTFVISELKRKGFITHRKEE